ncbi:MAG: hypothetical protein KGJ79_17685 [Alphaproteobacteria bacterium]|nr:hypothetical protein [Alphaproteobacteria bacterium]MDE2112972.1 hypothetical protein [Alphaproteobacteria bacterium]MDE2493325.1 hypothetical protein [Alphaproteobacteria bacterium]
MIETYAFLTAFAVQILVVSVLHPVWFARYVRAKAEAQFPDRDGKSIARFLSLYRVVNTGIAVLGLALLGWLFNHMRSADWNIVPVAYMQSGYSVVQLLPFVVASLIGAWIKRKAAHALTAAGQADSQSAAPWFFRHHPTRYRFLGRLGIFPLRRVHHPYPAAPRFGISRLLPPSHHHVDVCLECICRVLAVVSQKKVAARDASVPHAGGGGAGKDHLLRQHRRCNVLLPHHHASPSGSAKMGSVRDKRLYGDCHAFRGHDAVRAAASGGEGSDEF